eukprot:XP_001702151.1 predicted protein [Chlamydomonas reinhardtii]
MNSPTSCISCMGLTAAGAYVSRILRYKGAAELIFAEELAGAISAVEGEPGLPSASFTRTSTAAPSRRLWGLLWNVMHHQLPHAAAKNRGGRDSKAALFWSAHQRFYLQADAHSQQAAQARPHFGCACATNNCYEAPKAS